MDKGQAIVVVGAGVFGLTTALELSRRGYQNITVLDRYLPPVPDGSSVDISRVIRVDYADELYGRMARAAYQGWTTEYKDHYHECGIVMLSGPSGNVYMDKSQSVNQTFGQTLDSFDDANEIRKLYPGVEARLDGLKALRNPIGGWADAAGSIRELSVKCSQAGVSFVTGVKGTVLSLRYDGPRIVGMNVADGSTVSADRVVISTGAWSNRLLPLVHAQTASGQPVGMIKLSPEEASKLHGMPVMINLDNGLFCFPPTPDSHILKVVRHGYGYATEMPVNDSRGTVSSPKLHESNAQTAFVPQDADDALREAMRLFFPTFATREWVNQRLCWYSDTPEGDFIVDHHPDIAGLFVATGGAGHAFKMLPILGKYVVDCFENKAPKALRHKWRLRSAGPGGDAVKIGDGSRGGPPLRTLGPVEQSKL